MDGVLCMTAVAVAWGLRLTIVLFLVFGAIPRLMQSEAESLQACNPASMLLIKIHTGEYGRVSRVCNYYSHLLAMGTSNTTNALTIYSGK